jgi:4-hydroxythreonine-4-phosphate dehydrogenase
MDLPPLLAITMGDAAGVGPEIVALALTQERQQQRYRPLIIGSVDVLAHAGQLVGSPLAWRKVSTPTEAHFQPGTADVLDLGNLTWDEVTPGVVCPAAGRAAAEYVLKAGELALAGEVEAVVTAPLNKDAMRQGGYHYLGHTEILAELTGTPYCTTMLVSGELRVVHVTRHVPLSQVAQLISQERVLSTIIVTAESLRTLGLTQPRLAVAGLNPHNGEGGLLGREEIEVIGPAVEAAQAQGIDVRGPFAPDSIFWRALRGEFDVVVAMYHDQGHIAIKVHGFERSVTVTLGLPIIRTSVDHGTAFDIAWRGEADPQSMIEALRLAAQMARRRREEP